MRRDAAVAILIESKRLSRTFIWVMSGYSHLLPSMGKCELNLLNGYYIGIGGDDENANFQKLNSHRNPPIGPKSIAECHFY